MMYHKYIPQSEEFTDNKNIVISRCAPPTPLRLRQLPCLPTPHPGSAYKAGKIFYLSTAFFIAKIQCVTLLQEKFAQTSADNTAYFKRNYWKTNDCLTEHV
jgi:hypothetical protein